MDSKTITLSNGKVAVISEFKGKHIRKAQQIAGGEPGKMIFALIAEITTIDGQAIFAEDLDEMPGADVLKLQAELGANF